MLQVEQYRHEAEKYRSLAASETNQRVKASLLELAQQYEVLASKREEFLELQEEIRAKQSEREGG